MATVNLGAIKFNWKGAYDNGTQYQVDDVVSSGGSSYICILASQGNAVSNGTYWQQMSAAGTNGTDLTSTLTTQGDIVYRDGSGLARLGYGTAGQVLQTGGSGANPSWASVSSDFVKIQSTTVSSNVSSVTLTGFDDSVYASYYLRINNAKTELTGNQRGKISMRVQTSGGIQSGGTDYVYGQSYNYRRWDTDSQSQNTSFSEGSDNISMFDWNLSANDAQNTNIWFANPQSTAQVKIFDITTTAWKHTSNGGDGPYTFSPHDNTAVYQSTTALTGIHFFPTSNSASQISAGNFSLYGLKK